MKNTFLLVSISFILFIPKSAFSQVDEDKLGAWYIYAFNTTIKESLWGIQGDIQYRNWNMGGDLQQLLLRGGISYKPKNTNVKLTLGYGNVTSGEYGTGTSTTTGNRIYQEAIFPVKFGNRIYTNHRFRYEQRFVQNQDFRTRYRYNLFVNIPINRSEMVDKTVYLALYNELFINGQRNIGNNNTVEIFDRNRLYIGLGYLITKKLKVQFAIMKQNTDNLGKNQLQFSFNQTF